MQKKNCSVSNSAERSLTHQAPNEASSSAKPLLCASAAQEEGEVAGSCHFAGYPLRSLDGWKAVASVHSGDCSGRWPQGASQCPQEVTVAGESPRPAVPLVSAPRPLHASRSAHALSKLEYEARAQAAPMKAPRLVRAPRTQAFGQARFRPFSPQTARMVCGAALACALRDQPRSRHCVDHWTHFRSRAGGW